MKYDENKLKYFLWLESHVLLCICLFFASAIVRQKRDAVIYAYALGETFSKVRRFFENSANVLEKASLKLCVLKAIFLHILCVIGILILLWL